MATVSLLDVNSQLYLVDMAVRIERRSFPKNEAINAVDMLREWKKPNNDIFLATLDVKTLVGFAMFSRKGSHASLIKLVVREESRRNGIGSDLVRAGITFLHQRRCQDISLHVDPNRDAARALYFKLGFFVSGSVGDYYAPGRHADIMTLSL